MMMRRSSSVISARKPTEAQAKLTHEVATGCLSVRLFLVHELGPLRFVIAECPHESTSSGEEAKRSFESTNQVDELEHKSDYKTQTTDRYTVRIGQKVSCTCASFSSYCRHSLFVMIKVLRVAPDNPLVWQVSLTDAEISRILSGRASGQQSRTVNRTSSVDRKRDFAPKPVDTGDLCPICQEDLSNGGLIHCRRGCGRQVHVDCMAVWASYRESTLQPIACPLCRTDWGVKNASDLKMSSATASSGRNPSARNQKRSLPVTSTLSAPSCSVCRQRIRVSAAWFQCVFCAKATVCSNCYDNRADVSAVCAGPSELVMGDVTFKAPMHCYVAGRVSFNSAANDAITWQAARPRRQRLSTGSMSVRTPTQMLRSLMEDLQVREITPADYDTLLELERLSTRPAQATGTALHIFLSSVDVLPCPTGMSALDRCELCTLSISEALQSSSVARLPCTHVVHRQCLSSSLVFNPCAECPSCRSAVFQGLSGVVSDMQRRQASRGVRPRPQPLRERNRELSAPGPLHSPLLRVESLGSSRAPGSRFDRALSCEDVRGVRGVTAFGNDQNHSEQSATNRPSMPLLHPDWALGIRSREYGGAMRGRRHAGRAGLASRSTPSVRSDSDSLLGVSLGARVDGRDRGGPMTGKRYSLARRGTMH